MGLTTTGPDQHHHSHRLHGRGKHWRRGRIKEQNPLPKRSGFHQPLHLTQPSICSQPLIQQKTLFSLSSSNDSHYLPLTVNYCSIRRQMCLNAVVSESSSLLHIPTTPEYDSIITGPLRLEYLLYFRYNLCTAENFALEDALLVEDRTSPEGGVNLRMHNKTQTCRIWPEYLLTAALFIENWRRESKRR